MVFLRWRETFFLQKRKMFQWCFNAKKKKVLKAREKFFYRKKIVFQQYFYGEGKSCFNGNKKDNSMVFLR